MVASDGLFPARIYGLAVGILVLALAACAPHDIPTSPLNSLPVVITPAIGAGEFHFTMKDRAGRVVVDSNFSSKRDNATPMSAIDTLAFQAFVAYLLGNGPRALLDQDLPVRLAGRFMIVEALSRDAMGHATAFRLRFRGDSILTVRPGAIQLTFRGALMQSATFRGSDQANEASQGDPCYNELLAGISAVGASAKAGITSVLLSVAAFGVWYFTVFNDHCPNWVAQYLQDYSSLCTNYAWLCYGGGEPL